MARKRKTTRKNPQRQSSSRAIWKGSIDFGLVNIPVQLFTAETSNRLNFDLLDKRDFSRVRYRRVNEQTGREVPWDEIVKGYEYKKGEYVALSNQDFARANVEATQTISILNFVDAREVSPVYYQKPYFLAPQKNGRRAYVLLREVLRKTGRVGIATVVIRTRQHLAMIIPESAILVLELLRFPAELRDASGFDLSKGEVKPTVTTQEIKMAEQLVQTMSGKWQPDKYHDEYREDLMKIIDEKVESGTTKVTESRKAAPRREQRGKVIDIMDLLRQSVSQAKGKTESRQRRKAS